VFSEVGPVSNVEYVSEPDGSLPELDREEHN
jgi:hypothetical protein